MHDFVRTERCGDCKLHLEMIHTCFGTFCGMSCTTSDQHVELRMSRQLCNNKDLDTLLQWLNVRSPMSPNQELMLVATGVVGGSTINCDFSVEVVTIAMKTFKDIHRHR